MNVNGEFELTAVPRFYHFVIILDNSSRPTAQVHSHYWGLMGHQEIVCNIPWDEPLRGTNKCRLAIF